MNEEIRIQLIEEIRKEIDLLKDARRHKMTPYETKGRYSLAIAKHYKTLVLLEK